MTPWLEGRVVACCLAAPLLGWVVQPAGGSREGLTADWPMPAIRMLCTIESVYRDGPSLPRKWIPSLFDVLGPKILMASSIDSHLNLEFVPMVIWLDRSELCMAAAVSEFEYSESSDSRSEFLV